MAVTHNKSFEFAPSGPDGFAAAQFQRYMTSLLKNWLIVISILGASLIASHYGYRAHVERQVYLSVVESLVTETGSLTTPLSEMSVFLSRPIRCELNAESDVPAGLLDNFSKANEPSAEPIYLSALEGVVPIVSKEDTNKIHAVDYAWKPDRGVVWVSRVGLKGFSDQAAICLVKHGGRHAYAVVFFLRHNGGGWEIIGELPAHAVI